MSQLNNFPDYINCQVTQMPLITKSIFKVT